MRICKTPSGTPRLLPIRTWWSATIATVAILLSSVVSTHSVFGQRSEPNPPVLQIESPSLKCVLPFRVKSLEEFLEMSRQIDAKDSLEGIAVLLKVRLSAGRATGTRESTRANACVVIEQGTTVPNVTSLIEWKRNPEQGDLAAAEASLSSSLRDAGPLLEAISRRARIETGLSEIASIDCEYTIWGDMSGRFKTPRRALAWYVRLAGNGKTGRASILVFPALKGEPGVTLAGSRLRMLLLDQESVGGPSKLDRALQCTGTEIGR